MPADADPGTIASRLTGALASFPLVVEVLTGDEFDVDRVDRIVGPALGAQIRDGADRCPETLPDPRLVDALALLGDTALDGWARLDDDGRQRWLASAVDEDRELLSRLLVLLAQGREGPLPR
jgi:hypothetical protein